MTASAGHHAPHGDPDGLPRVIPIFPLTGVLLLPRGTLPLNIFEPRYLAMVRDALDGDGVIGMIQPREGEDARFEPPVYATGCLGRIHEHKDLPDGRMLITLRGACRFTITEELARTTPYRKVVVTYDAYRGDCDLPPPLASGVRVRLIATLERYLEDRSLSADWSVIREAPDETLVNALAMICPFEPNEKQALLEARDLNARAEIMVMLMSFALAEPGDTPGMQH